MEARKLLQYLFETNEQSLKDEERLVGLLPENSFIRQKLLNRIEKIRKEDLELQKRLFDDVTLTQSLSMQHVGILSAINQLTTSIGDELGSPICYEYNKDGVPCYRINGVLIPSIRWNFLKSGQKQLKELHVTPDEKKQPEPPKPHSFFKRAALKFITSFDNTKKFADGIDDIVSATGRIKGVPTELVNVIGPYFNASFGMVVQGTEAGRGLYIAIKNLRKKIPGVNNTHDKMRRSKILSNFLIFGAGTAGVGMCVAYILFITGIAVTGGVFLNILIPAMIGLIASIALAHNIYRYRAANAETMKLIDEQKEIGTIKREIKERNSKLRNLRERMDNAKDSSIKLNDLSDLTNQLTQLTNENMEAQNKLIKLESKLENQTNLTFWKDKRSSAIRNTVFRTIEIIATITIIAGLILGTAAIVGAASAATFGAAMIPSIVIFTGVGLGFALKLYEHFDKKRDYVVTNTILNTIKNWVADLFSRERSPDLIAPKKKEQDITISQDKKPVCITLLSEDPIEPSSYSNGRGAFFGGSACNKGSTQTPNALDARPSKNVYVGK